MLRAPGKAEQNWAPKSETTFEIVETNYYMEVRFLLQSLDKPLIVSDSKPSEVKGKTSMDWTAAVDQEQYMALCS